MNYKKFKDGPHFFVLDSHPDEISKWCEENLTSLYYVTGGMTKIITSVLIYDDDDAMFFKLKWGDKC